MKKLLVMGCLLLIAGGLVALGGRGDASPPGTPESAIPWPAGLPVYDHVVIVVEENKDFDQVVGSPEAPFINRLRTEGANFTRMFGEEHHSQGNYFWLFSGDNHGVGFRDGVPHDRFEAPNLGAALIKKGFSFKGYSESLPAIGSTVVYDPPGAQRKHRVYARKHAPWVSFTNVPNGTTAEQSSNLTFAEFPKGAAAFAALPTVAFVIANLKNDMHDSDEGLSEKEALKQTVRQGDKWLETNLGAYHAWTKEHNSLLIVTFDESYDGTGLIGLTDPFALADTPAGKDLQNRVCTIFAGARIKPGDYAEGKGVTHVNILRTLEAMYGLLRAGAQQPNAAKGGIRDDYVITDVFENVK
jgi:phosphatidylinositol-3-phosphatase